MKLKEIKQIIQAELPNLKIQTEQQTHGNQTYQVFKEAAKYRKAVENISETGLFINEINHLRNTLLFTSSQGNVKIVNNESRPVIDLIDRLLILVNGFLESLKEVIPQELPESISIKLPNVKDFDSLSKAAADFHKVLSQTILSEEIGGKIEIKNVENGSIWLDVFLGTSAAISLVGGLTWSAAVVYKKLQEGRILEKQVKALDIKNASLKEIQEKQKELLNQVIEVEANHLHSENFSSKDHEQVERLKHSIRLLAELLDKGAEVHPALQAPEQVSNLYPDFKKLGTIQSQVKQITEGN